MLAAAAAVLFTSGMAIAHASNTPFTAAADRPIVAVPAPPVQIEPVAAVKAEPTAEPKLDPRAVTCIAKVVHHEAANQQRKGQIAVAHVLVNRVKAGFADHVCAVANQRGQFFPLNSYHPDKRSAEWADAVDVARDVLAGEVRDHSNGALFFHANWARLDSFFRTRTKVARLEDHDFFR